MYEKFIKQKKMPINLCSLVPVTPSAWSPVFTQISYLLVEMNSQPESLSLLSVFCIAIRQAFHTALYIHQAAGLFKHFLWLPVAHSQSPDSPAPHVSPT